MTGYYLAPKFLLWGRLSLAACALVLCSPAARTQSSPAASPRGEAYEKCKSFFSESANELPDGEGNNAFLNSCGWKFYDYHELPQGGKAFAQARAMAERRRDQVKLADALDGAANIDRLSGDFGQAELLLQQALHLAEEIQNKDELSKIYLSFGRLRGDQGRENEACDSISRSLKLLEELDNPLRLAIANNNMGTCFLRRGDYTNALQSFQRGLIALQQINEELKSSVVLDNIAQCYWRLGDFSKATETINQSLTIREKYKDELLVGKSFDSLGNVYLQQGNYAAALEAMQKGFELRTKANFPLDATESLNNIATVYEAQGEYAEAALYLRRGLQSTTKLANKDLEAEIETHLGEVYFLEGNYAQAYNVLQHAMDNSRAADDKVQLAAAQYVLGRLYVKQGRLDSAKDVLQQARDFYDSKGLIIDLGNTLVELSEVERRSGRLSEGSTLAVRAEELGERIGSPELKWRSLTALGRLSAALGHSHEAAKSFESAITAIEEERNRVAGEENRARFFSERVAPYQERIAVALASGNIEDAFYYSERSKARVLLDVIGADHIPLSATMSEDERERETRLRTILASLNTQILVAGQANPPDEKRLAGLKQQRDEARLKYEDFESTLYSKHPELAVSRGTVPTARLADAKALLPTGSAAIIEYVVVRNRTWAFVISRRGVRVSELALDNSQLQRQVERFRQQLAKRDLAFAEAARQLYQQVLGAESAALKDKTELVVIPDGILWDLPFQALQSGPDHYLIEDSAISYAPSLTALREMSRPRSHPSHQQSTLIAFGNPTIGGGVVSRRKTALMDDHLAPLPEAEIQAKSVAEIYSPDSRVYVGTDAREDRWKAEAPAYRIVHLATHGVLDNRSPLYSYLVLSPSTDPKDPEDGLLEAWEIMRVSLSADLVVLSACETARGKISAGEAMIGLTWAFFVAGSPATLVTQWKVESASSTALMTEFHRRWKGGRNGLSKARALQLAALQMLHNRNYSNPFYWAGYILVGNGQ